MEFKRGRKKGRRRSQSAAVPGAGEDAGAWSPSAAQAGVRGAGEGSGSAGINRGSDLRPPKGARQVFSSWEEEKACPGDSWCGFSSLGEETQLFNF